MDKLSKWAKILIAVWAIALSAVIVLVMVTFLPKDEEAKARPFGVWWWDNRLDDTYLDFAEENGVNEIYYYASSFNQKTTDFISSAVERGIRVYWLTGEYQWIEDMSGLTALLDEYFAFQRQSEYAFSGIHFDIEPHQHPQFEERRQELLTSFVRLTAELHATYPDEFIEYDLPFWLDDEIEFNGAIKPAFAHIIDNSSRVTLMSYRDSCEQIYSCAEDEIRYAESVGKKLNLGVETGASGEGSSVTFYEEGAQYMKKQLEELKERIPSDFGIAVHHIRTWRELKN